MAKSYEAEKATLTAALAQATDEADKARIEAHLNRFLLLEKLQARKAAPAPAKASS